MFLYMYIDLQLLMAFVFNDMTLQYQKNKLC
jgi:hypothetical protein